MMTGLNIDTANERDAYFSDEEYAASLLGVSLSSLDTFGPPEFS